MMWTHVTLWRRPFRPAIACFVLLFSLCGTGVALGPSAHAQTPSTPGASVADIARATDVEWLERIGSPAAYARLGEIGTPRSLAAILRIETAAAAITLVPPTVSADGWPRIGSTLSDTAVVPIASTIAPDGTTYAVVVANLLGGSDVFLLSRPASGDRRRWARPKLIAPFAPRDVRDPVLAWHTGGTLTLTFTDPRDEREIQFSILEIERDSDGDGWTDIEELRIGTDEHAPDTDGDGMPDGADVCPLYAAPQEEASNEDAIILRKAIFATFGLTGSRQLLYVTPGTPRVHVFGYGAPILFDHPMPADSSAVGTYVTWRIAEKNATMARVELTEWEGSRSGSRQTVVLKKVVDLWAVIGTLN